MRNSHKWLNVLAFVGTVALVIGTWYFFFGNHSFWAEDGESFGELWHEKGHWYLELAIGTIQIFVIDIFIGLVVWRLVLKPYLANRHRTDIAEIVEAEHDIHDYEHDHEEDDHTRIIQLEAELAELKTLIGKR